VIRVYRPDGTFKSMRAEALASALDIRTQAIQKFQPTPGALPGNEGDYQLVEVGSDGGTSRSCWAGLDRNSTSNRW